MWCQGYNFTPVVSKIPSTPAPSLPNTWERTVATNWKTLFSAALSRPSGGVFWAANWTASLRRRLHARTRASAGSALRFRFTRRTAALPTSIAAVAEHCGRCWGGRREPLSSASGPAPGTLSRCGKACAHAGRGSVAMAAEVNGTVPAAGEALGGLGRCGRVWSPGCSQHPVLSSRAAAAGPGVGVLRTWGTHLFKTLNHLCRISSMGRLGALGLAGDRGCRQAAALPSSRLIAACWARGGALPR